jgi:hypothetical protein
LALGAGAAAAAQTDRPTQYILLNRMPGNPWHQSRPDSINRAGFEEIRKALPETGEARIRIGIGYIFSYLQTADDSTLTNSLRRFLALARETETPVLVQFDGENWWDARPDLWNWWDSARPGFDPANRENVEWTSWSPDDAVKIAWRNWGRQIRVRPPPNLMSPRYRRACHEKMALLTPIILEWARALPADKKSLFVGLKLGHESSIGVNAWHYPNGNALLDQPANEDPATGLKANLLPGRGVATLGYAAVKTAGIRGSGEISEADLAEVARRHLEDLCEQASRLGVPREKLFTHGAGWKDGELLYGAPVNRFSCPGWSFYQHANDPRKDQGVQAALQRSDAPAWAAAEWLYQGPRETAAWRRALDNTLADRRCRFLCIYNWEGIRDSAPVLEAIRQTVQASAR